MKSIDLNEKAKLIISFDDYDILNEQLAEVLLKFNLPATFFIETGAIGAINQIIKLDSMGFDIGCHTVNHISDLKSIPLIEAKSEIEISKRIIEAQTGKPCEIFAYPKGKYNEDIIGILKQLDFKEARTVDVLQTEVLSPFRTKTTIHIFDGRKEYQGRTWLQMAEFYLDYVLKKGGIFHLWGHAREIDRENQWNNLHKFLSKMSNLTSQQQRELSQKKIGTYFGEEKSGSEISGDELHEVDKENCEAIQL